MDTHVHSRFSPDSNAKISDITAQGYPVTLTDHYDVHTAQDTIFQVDVKEFFKELLPQRNDNFLLGIEIGLRQEGREGILNLLESYPFDFVLGSVHAPFDLDSPNDFYMEQTFTGMTALEAQQFYFGEVLRSVQVWREIDALAHLDYVLRAAKTPGKRLLIEECQETIEAIFLKMVEFDIALEVNTRRFSQEHSLDDWRKLLALYRVAGGKFVTIGSDAHAAQGIGRQFEQAKSMLDQFDLTWVYFKERKRYHIKENEIG